MSNNSAVGHRSSPQNQRRLPSSNNLLPPPAGFESLYLGERSKIKNCFEAFVLPLHWAIIRGGLRLRTTDANPTASTIPLTELTELLPSDWTSHVTTKPEEGTEQPMKLLVLRYWDHSNSSVHYEAKILEIVKNQSIVVILFRAANAYGFDGNVQVGNKKDIDSNSPTRNSAGTTFQVQDYVIFNQNSGEVSTSTGSESVASKPWFDIYKNPGGIEKLVWEQLMEPIGLSILGQPRQPGPYDSKIPAESNTESQQQQQQSQPQHYIPTQPQPLRPHPSPIGGIGGPLYVPPAVPAGGGLGRSDLDPLGGFGNGMVADPRGFRAPQAGIPFGPGGGGLIGPPPGARFDPFGPPNPVPNPVAPRPQPGTGGNWAVPNPDGEQPPPGFDDMFI